MRFLPALVIVVSFFIFPSLVNAQVVINEFSAKSDPEWVELYNSGNVSTSIDQWILQDGNNLTSDDITLTGSIGAGEYLVINHDKGWLNDSSPGDTITLINNKSDPIDAASYNSAKDNKTISRIPNATGEFTENTEPTPGGANQAPPSPTPPPDPSPTSTSTPEPSNSQEDSSTPTSTPVPTTTLQSTSYKITNTTPKSEGEVSGALQAAEVDLSSFTIDPSPSPDPEEQDSRPFPFVPIISGTLFLGAAGVYGYQKYRARKPSIKKNKPDTQV